MPSIHLVDIDVSDLDGERFSNYFHEVGLSEPLYARWSARTSTGLQASSRADDIEPVSTLIEERLEESYKTEKESPNGIQ